MKPDLIQYTKQWLIKANEDISVIVTLVKDGKEMILGPVCFHCQQAVEKFLKAFLVMNSVYFKKTHDVNYLLDECTKLSPEMFTGIDLKELSEYGVNIRYPGIMIQPTTAETKEYIEIAKQIKQIVEPLINKQINDE